MENIDNSLSVGEYAGLIPKIESRTIFEAAEQESDLLLRVRLLEAQISSWLEAAPLLQDLIRRCDALECHMGLKPSVESTKRRGRGRPRKVVVQVEEETDNDNIVSRRQRETGDSDADGVPEEARDVEDEVETTSGQSHLIGSNNSTALKGKESSSFRCKLCPPENRTELDFSSPIDLANHYSSAHPIPRSIPQTDSSVTAFPEEDQEAGDQHSVATLATMRKQRCPDCLRVLSGRPQLYRHMIHFHGAMPFTCRICGKAFQKKNEVTTHRATVHAKIVRAPGRPKKLAATTPTALHCPEEGCRRTFTRRWQLREHIIACRGEKPFICDICGSRHARGGCLRAHKRHMHGIGGEPFRAPCPVCGVVYVKSGMKVHLRTHTGEKPFVCTICGAAFTMKQSLATHERGHTGEKPFACIECGEKFKSAQTLKVHSYRHTGKPFECGICGMRFTRTAARNQHMRQQHAQTRRKRGRGRPPRNIEPLQIIPHEPSASTVSSDQEGWNLK